MYPTSPGRPETLVLQVSGTNRESIELFASRFGGAVHEKRGLQVGIKQQWLWRLTGARALDALSALVPSLRVKREEAEIALTVPAIAGRRRLSDDEKLLRHSAAQQLRGLKRLGVIVGPR